MNPSTSNDKREREQRQLELSWLMAKTVVHVDEKLTDLVTLQQQAGDLLRRILNKERMP